MSDKLIEAIKADVEKGAPGPWTVHDCEGYGDRCKTFFQEVWNDSTDILVTTEVTRAHNDGGTVNMRRIARVPDMEARILADATLIAQQQAEIAALRAKVARLRAFIEDVANTEWEEDEPGANWCPEEGERYVQEMEAFANWVTQRARAAIARAEEAGQ